MVYHYYYCIAILLVLVLATLAQTTSDSLTASKEPREHQQRQQQVGWNTTEYRERRGREEDDEEETKEDLSSGHSFLYKEPSDEVKQVYVRQLKANLLRCMELNEEPSVDSRLSDAKIPPELLAQYLNQREQMRPIVPSDDDFYGRLPRAHPLVKRHADGGSSSTGTSRQRNSTNKPRYSRIADKCAKRNMRIKFDHVGWSDWIIAPSSYNAYYCAGECSYPMSDYQNATNHAIIQSIFHSVGRSVPRSCCAPIKMGKIAILYQLDGNVHMRQYDDMVVETCGCL